MRKFAVSTFLFLLLLVLWAVVLAVFRGNEQVLFPDCAYEVYALTDGEVGGFSTSELARGDSEITAAVNVRSGMAYPYAGIGFNLMSVGNRPATGFFDFSRFDSVEVIAETGRMRNVSVRILTHDPVYSKDNVYGSYRPLQKSFAVSNGGVKMSLHELNVPDRWFAALGLEENDGLKYYGRGVILEVFNGEGTLLGIPDEIKLQGIRLWGEKHAFVSTMYALLVILALTWIASIVYIRRRK
ncbi:MAG: hypothetical protein HUK19_04340 [Fibrobacter sp.]|nr:hypothetical protein [Fibrobacter sp.]